MAPQECYLKYNCRIQPNPWMRQIHTTKATATTCTNWERGYSELKLAGHVKCGDAKQLSLLPDFQIKAEAPW